MKVKRKEVITHVWQSQVEIEDYYSTAYFDRIAVSKVSYYRTSVKG